MSLSRPEYAGDINEMTVNIQKSFSSGTEESLKWSLLKQYQTLFLPHKNYTQTVAATYATVLSTLLDSLKETLFTQKWQEILFDELFLQGVHHQAFMILVNRLTEKENYEQQKIIKLLQKFLKGPSLDSLFLYQCVSHAEWDIKFVSKTKFWDDLIANIVSLPDRIANKTKGKFSKLFNPCFYVPLLLSSVVNTLRHIHDKLRNSQDCSLEFLAKLTGKLCITGNADVVAKKYSKELISVSKTDFIWRRISHNFIMKLPFNCLDTFIVNLLCVIPWYGYVTWLLGDAGVKIDQINYIMTVKLFFVHVSKQDIALQNTIGYFASSSERASHFIKILNALLDSWMDQKALKRLNTKQQIYIASALMVCAGWIRKSKHNYDTKVYINKVLAGTQLRIGSSDETVRSLGMIVGSSLLESFDPDAPPFEFEHSNTDLLQRLMHLLEVPSKPDDNTLIFEDLKCFEEVELERNEQGNSSSAGENVEETFKYNELDSDDDLEPYDMSNDVKSDELKRPLYLRDCMNGLIDQQDPGWTEMCLRHAEELIKGHPYAAKEVAEELAKIVLHLDDNFAITDFLALRHQILITLTVQCPVVVANYLTSQFCAKDYNIRQRLDILEVLAASSTILSSGSLLESKTQPVKSKEDFISRTESSWKLITLERLEAKTKRFTKVQKPILKENKFSAVAANFFYPLINSYSSSSKVFKLWDDDSYVLGRLVYTLGIIMFSASNTVHCCEMGTTFLQFLASIRSHSDIFVRQSIIFAVATVYNAVPSAILFTEMLHDVVQTNEWLLSVAGNDPESKCVEKAIYTLSIFQNLAIEEPLLLPDLKNFVLP